MDVYPEILLADGYEDAFMGLVQQFSKDPIAVYDTEKCIEILISKGMTREEAWEYFEFNTQGAWVGEATPVFFTPYKIN